MGRVRLLSGRGNPASLRPSTQKEKARCHDGKPGGADQYSLRWRLKKLGYATYREYLISEHWRKFKARFRDSNNFQGCHACRREDVPVQLHHWSYAKLGRETFSDVFPLCDDCHGRVHAIQKQQLANGTYRGLWASTRGAVDLIRKELGIRKIAS